MSELSALVLVRVDIEDVEAGAAIGLRQRLDLQFVGLSHKGVLQSPVGAGDVLIEALRHKGEGFFVTHLRIVNSLAFPRDRSCRLCVANSDGARQPVLPQ